MDSNISNPSEYYLPIEAAKLLKKSRMTVFRWMKAGYLNTTVIAGMRVIPMSEIERVKAEGKKARKNGSAGAGQDAG